MIGDDDLRDCFAMFAMLGFMSRGSVWDVKEAWEIADAMLEARRAPKEPEVGIVAVKSRRRK
jgi:hypothetical protein